MICPLCEAELPPRAAICPKCQTHFSYGPPAEAQAAPSPRPAPAGERLGTYQILRKLGEGGFGVVYLAHSTQIDMQFALKTYHDESLFDAAARAQFLAEAQTWIDLERHPFIVCMRFVDEIHGRLYLVMDYVAPDAHGVMSLETLLQRRRPSLVEVLTWGIQIAYGMEHANARGIVAHRDLKPANVLLDQGRARISDFGLAAVKGRLTGLGGTPAYMPVEQWNDARRCDARSDVYALGVMLYELLAGRLPFMPKPMPDPRQVMKALQQMHAQYPPPKIDTPAWPIVQRCLGKLPNQRYPSFAALRADLEALLAQQGGPRVDPPRPEEIQLDASDWSHKGLSLFAVGKLDEALAAFARALALDPQYAGAHHNRGNVLLQLGRAQDALTAYEAALALAPDDPLTLRAKASALEALGRTDEARALRSTALAADTTSPGAWFDQACALESQGRIDEAMDAYRAAIAIDPHFRDAWLNLANAFSAQKRFAEAIDAFGKVVAIDPSDARNFSNLSHLYGQLGRHQEALVAADRALTVDPKLPAAHYNRGMAMKALGRTTEARQSLQTCLELAADFSAAAFHLGQLRLAAGELAEAATLFQSVLAHDQRPDARKAAGEQLDRCVPPTVVALTDQALAYAKRGEIESALPLWERALAAAPFYARARYDRAVGLLKLRRLPEALEAFRALADDPRFGASARDALRKVGGDGPKC